MKQSKALPLAKRKVTKSKTVAVPVQMSVPAAPRPTENEVTLAMQGVIDALHKLHLAGPDAVAPKADRDFYRRWLDEEKADLREGYKQ